MKLVTTSGAIGVAGVVLTGIAALVAPEAAAHAWLVAWTAAVNVALGCLVLVAIAHLAPIRWFAALRRPVAAVAATLPLLAVLFLPILLAAGDVYRWTGPIDPDLPREVEEALRRQRAWLDLPWWTARSIAWLVIPSAFAWWIRALDRRGELWRVQVVASVSLPIVAICWTLGSVDWWMSLDPRWTSTILGMWTFSGGTAGAFAVSILVARALERGARIEALPPDVYHALGRLLLAFIVLWAYTTFDQMLIQWIADLPDETRFWIPRLRGGWYAALWVLGLGHFAVPFALLLSRRFKRSRGPLAALAAWILVMRWLDALYLVEPMFHASPPLHLAHVPAIAGVVGLVVASAAWLADEPVPAAATFWTWSYRSP